MSTCCAYITLKFCFLTCWPFQLIFSCLFCVLCFCLSIPSPPPSQNRIVLVCRSKLAYFTPTNNIWFLSWKFISCSTVWATLQLVMVKINDEVEILVIILELPKRSALLLVSPHHLLTVQASIYLFLHPILPRIGLDSKSLHVCILHSWISFAHSRSRASYLFGLLRDGG